MSQNTDPPAPQTAMLLTEQEWDDLAVICRVYVGLVEGWKDAETVRRRTLCERIEEACHIRHTVVVHYSELTRRGNVAVPCGQVLIGGVCPIHGARRS